MTAQTDDLTEVWLAMRERLHGRALARAGNLRARLAVEREYEGLTQSEAARRLGISVSGMKSRVQRARGRLRELLTGCCAVAMDARGAVRHVRAEGSCSCGGD
ncbi:sigma factor-like helix-turn-helix DNA-binding protein [Nonomuraea mesophila]|uniref:sigma factor-like helix-turn-helix DNA-binding protein n=1 Tax=Nonomuraea mesophila TaxID=2530382 RepID=UPI001C703236|nr:sigma factor-like helix-turn-helix DNA-binding protein [Nonomuraea mesophila]